MKRVCLVKSEICDAYTGIFKTRRENHNLIKILTFYENNRNIKFLTVKGENFFMVL